MFLMKKDCFPIKRIYRNVGAKKLTIKNATLHNLQNISVDIPLSGLIGIAGVSGSGKSSLISDTLVPYLKEMMKRNCVTDDDSEPAKAADEEDIYEDIYENDYKLPDDAEGETIIEGTENIKRCYVIDQRPIGRSRTSCPATYTGIMDRIRKIFADSPMAKEKGYDIGYFSLNSKGKCQMCKGDGAIHWHVGFGNFIDIKCEKCGGHGFIPETMSVMLDGKTICDVLDMSVDEALEFFKDKDPIVANILATLKRVGMGYIKLGQKTPTISGGESQRIKLAKELSKGRPSDGKASLKKASYENTSYVEDSRGNTTSRKALKGSLYILDEPTTGLSMSDSEKLLELINELVDMGNTVIITEHDPNMLSNCDWLIEMGPGGGKEGGYVIAEGTPKQLKEDPKSIIGGYLK